MDLICKNEAVPRQFVGDNSFRDTEIEKIEICRVNCSVALDVDFRMRQNSDWARVRLRFEECIFYSLYSTERDSYVVENLKFFITDEGHFYASFDPYGEEEIVSDRDNDVIHAKKINAYQVT
ncbi:hypothetical protein [uncultured Roseobacter sp.]|uniref:hypothetical protein n=1 Tax=uncultured Roseobacter sp. TaxID=114847 RepID=UPI0026306731|nr:hypothetical protein [uncultured Roseobacter sp.]